MKRCLTLRTLSGSASALRELRRRLTSPRLLDEHPKISNTDCLEPHEHRWKSTVVRLGEELRGLRRNQHLPLTEVGDAHSEDAGIRHACFLRRDALHPNPDKSFERALVSDRKGEAILHLFGLGQGQRD